MAYGGFKLITSGGNESERAKGMNAIQAAVWGILITFGAYVIVNAIIGGLAGNSFFRILVSISGMSKIINRLQEVGNVYFFITDKEGNDFEINISDFLLRHYEKNNQKISNVGFSASRK